eukprot:3726384-Rhodomonas_salina.1
MRQGQTVLGLLGSTAAPDREQSPSVTASSLGERVGARTHSCSLSDAQEQQAIDAAMQQAEQDSIGDPSDRAQAQCMVNPDNHLTWVSGADVPLTASIPLLLDKLLGRALVHNKFTFKLPKEW